MMKHLQFLLVILFFSTLSINAQTSNLWGMTRNGGQNDEGTIFKTDLNGENHTVVYSFTSNQGTLPHGSLIQASNGKLYGMVMSGVSCGAIFEFDPSTETYIKKAEFDNTSGCAPKGSLVQASDGLLYGMTELGGDFNKGTLFKFDTEISVITKVLDFDVDNGERPVGNSLIEVSGKLYGMTKSGGTSFGTPGVLFEYDLTSGNYNVKFNFDSFNGLGDNPYGSLTQASNGKLYGMTIDGGIGNNDGVIFEYNIATETVSRKYDFNNFDDGLNPQGDLIETSSGIFYGMTQDGGVNSEGVIFEYNLTTNTYTKKFDFDRNSSGSYPQGSLMQASNGKLYGMTNEGGANDWGVFFEYDPTSDIFTKKLDFNDTNGRNPVYTKLVEVNTLTTETYVPDDNFEQALIDLGYDSGALNDSVPTANINTITSLDVFGKNIAELTGIEDFTALVYLSCQDNQITSLDVSQNTALTNLFCHSNQLSGLDLSQNILLEQLSCSNNQLTNLDVTKNASLIVLGCNLNQLTSLDLSQNTSLKTLGCFQNQLTGLDVSQNTLLEDLNCNTNQLTSLDVSQNTALEKLLINNNQITGIDLTHNTALTVLFSLLNPITSLDLSQNAALIDLDCNTSKLTYLNVKNGNNTNFTRFRTTGNPDLTCIEVDDAAWSIANWSLIDATSTFVNNQEECTALGTETFEQMKIALYPNPTKGNVTIETGDLTDLDISVFNITGEKVYSIYNVTEAKVVLPTGNLPKGVYFIKIRTNKQQQIIKLVKE